MKMEKIVDLEGVLYNEDGKFMPFADAWGNINGKVALTRNTYMEAEREYFEQLLVIDNLYEKFEELLNYDNNKLYEIAMLIQSKLENGDLETNEEKEQMKLMTPEERDSYHMQKLIEAEGMMCLLLAAIRDKVKILELVKHFIDSRTR